MCGIERKHEERIVKPAVWPVVNRSGRYLVGQRSAVLFKPTDNGQANVGYGLGSFRGDDADVSDIVALLE